MKPTLLKQIRTQQGLKQLEIANKVNISLMSYQRYEYGERVPDKTENVSVADRVREVRYTGGIGSGGALEKQRTSIEGRDL